MLTLPGSEPPFGTLLGWAQATGGQQQQQPQQVGVAESVGARAAAGWRLVSALGGCTLHRGAGRGCQGEAAGEGRQDQGGGGSTTGSRASTAQVHVARAAQWASPEAPFCLLPPVHCCWCKFQGVPCMSNRSGSRILPLPRPQIFPLFLRRSGWRAVGWWCFFSPRPPPRPTPIRLPALLEQHEARRASTHQQRCSRRWRRQQHAWLAMQPHAWPVRRRRRAAVRQRCRTAYWAASLAACGRDGVPSAGGQGRGRAVALPAAMVRYGGLSVRQHKETCMGVLSLSCPIGTPGRGIKEPPAAHGGGKAGGGERQQR